MKAISSRSEEIRIQADGVGLDGNLEVPAHAAGIVLFAHGSGSSRHSRRNQFVARSLREAGMGTLLFDLLTREEEEIEQHTAHLRFDIEMLARRLVAATRWARGGTDLGTLPIGYFGASMGGGAALVAAAEIPEEVRAVVSRGGRPDLAGEALGKVRPPTLLIVGGWDGPVIEMNREAFRKLNCVKRIEIVPEATHLFEEPGKLEEVARLSAGWFAEHFRSEA